MHITEPLFQADNRFAICGKPEVARLDNSCVDGANRNLMQARPFHGQENVGSRRIGGSRAITQWVTYAPAAVIQPGAGIGRVIRFETDQVLIGTLKADRRGMNLAGGGGGAGGAGPTED